MNSRRPALLGRQEPRVTSAPAYETSAGSEAVRLAAAAGIMLDPWQAYVLEHSLGERDDLRWSAREIGVVVPRQNGKGEILVARELAGLLLFGERLIIHTAHLFGTTKDAYLRLRAALEALPEGKNAKFRNSNQDVSVELPSGAQVKFVARTEGSGRGLTSDVIVLDEAYALNDDQMAALLPTQSAVDNPQVWYTSSAGMPASETLARVRDRGIVGDRRLAYFEWSAAEDANLDDREAWATANPALGRISLETVETERAAMDEERFARERLGIWYDPRAETVIDPDAWAALTDDESEPTDPVCFAFDVTPDRSFASIGVAGLRADGLLHLEVIDNKRGTRWVAERLAELQRKWRRSAVVVDPASPAGSLLPELDAAGVVYTLVTTREVVQACGALYDGVKDRKLRHLKDSRLTDAISAARKRLVGDSGAWLWHRKDATTDISPLVAITLALAGHTALMQQPTGPVRNRGKARSY